MKDEKEFEKIIIGRVDPHIYAFSTSTIPNYLKIGDTCRPVGIRLEEWRKKYANLKCELDEVAKVDDDVFFRDYAVHQYLEQALKKHRLARDDVSGEVYYSNEFFEETSPKDIMMAVSDIKNDYNKNSMKYQFYNAEKLPTVKRYASTGYWNPRPNQKAVIENFKKAYKGGRTNLLLYAVMRFGKTFTAMCCANEMQARIVLIVSAKKDVSEEWKKTIESADNFDFEFITTRDLLGSHTTISDAIKGKKRIAIFATLQELSGTAIKEKHKELFSNKIDLLLVDETHFGARAKEYGKVLKDKKEQDYIDSEKADQELKLINSKVRIHLSGTPYRILMSREFEQEDIIGFCQASDILDAQKIWDETHFEDIEMHKINEDTGEEYQEWDNPYFGCPQMVRFAFTPSKKMRLKMDCLKNHGEAYGLSELFRPLSIRADKAENYQKFKHEDEVVELLHVIDGSKDDEGLLGLLNYDRIKEGKLCHHIVMVLPFCASCDAMEKLIAKHKKRFLNLGDYQIINISGIGNKYRTVNDVKSAIKDAEAKNKKTITLTVNRMLTGSTVEEWDTMIYLKESSSPQEYDQAIFRLQNQFVETCTYRDKKTGAEKIMKINKKPQTLLVDLDPNRVFRMQEERALIYNASINKKGRKSLEAQVKKELGYSPIIVLNKNHIHKVDAPELMAAIDNYSRERGIYDETQEIPIDLGLLDLEDVRKEIERQGEFKARSGFELTYDGDDEAELPNDKHADSKKNSVEQKNDDKSGDKKKDIKKQFRTYYSKILFYSALTSSNVKTLEEIINSLDKNRDNTRIAEHLGLDKNILALIQTHMDFFALDKLDNTIARINRLSNDKTLTELERAHTAINKFDRLSDSEIITPKKICEDMVDAIGAKNVATIIKDKKLILDVASKEAEYALAIVDVLTKHGVPLEEYRDSIYSISTSSIAYEFTRKIYSIIGLNINNISYGKTAYDLADIQRTGGNVKEFLEEIFNSSKNEMDFDAIVGNPPYQLTGGSGGNADAPMYQYFAEAAFELNPKYCALIIPTRWFSGGRENLVGNFRKYMLNNRKLKSLVVFSDPKDVFPNVEVKGGVCYYLNDRSYNGDCKYTLNYRIGSLAEKESLKRDLGQFDVLVREPIISDVVQKVLDVNHKDGDKVVESIISNDTPFGISSNPKGAKKKQNAITVFDDAATSHDVKLFYIERSKRKTGFVKRADIKKNANDVDSFKVFIPGGYGAGEGFPHQILGVPEYGGSKSVCSQSYLYASFGSAVEAKNFIKYLETRFFRALVLARKIAQSAPRKSYRFVPLQDFSASSDIEWNASIEHIENQLYEKYKLSKSEVEYIHRIIKKMDSQART
ncbi:Eco57I restriction-modification methylase domain-containing protein [Candidatus Saccharibacteria bacterium]|nr:Eco57I restriction-modification methylase domain-containing protein [Candidatus Saccharibacteria bacterium]